MSETAKASKRILSGMQPTGTSGLHIGNLEGALRNWVRLQDESTLYCCIVDWHSLTTRYADTQQLWEACLILAAEYIAAGIDPKRSMVFIQSQVKEHAELHLLLSMITPLGWLERVPTFKEKRELISDKGEGDESISYGLLGYPCLQSADILLYRPLGVPVGKDQAAHLELSREICRRFNHLYGPVFPEPKSIISEVTAVVPGLDGRKMSKSYGNAIYLSDSADVVADKVKNAFTTTTKLRKTDPGVPETCVVCQLRRVYDPEGYSTSWDEDRAGIRGCMQSKKELTEILNTALEPIRQRRAELLSDKGELENILKDGADRARETAVETMDLVRKAMGLR